MKNTYTFFLLIVLITFNSCKASNKIIDKSVVKEFNIEQYLGKWYEIARFDNNFEKGLVGVTARYSLIEDSLIKVENSGYKNTLSGEKSEIIGKAKIPDKKIPAKLKVSFFWFFYADYYVLDIDSDYKWALVGSSSDKFLWILSRTPKISDNLYLELKEKLNKRGYDTSKLIKVEQN